MPIRERRNRRAESRHCSCSSKGMSKRRPGRLKSFPYIGKYSYFLTFCTFDRREAFTDVEPVEYVHSEILRTCAEREFEVTAGVFMPDHLHMVVRGLTDRSNLKSGMKLARQRSAHTFRIRVGGSLWQDGYFDHIIRDADDERERVRYIVQNPLQAHLCEEPGDYPYSWWPGRPWDPARVRGAEL